jgi:hypothetical protein
MHTDKYGRNWLFKSSYADDMLRISGWLAEFGFNTDRKFSGSAFTYAQYAQDYPGMEPYLLKMGDRWVMGMLYGDGPGEYISPGLDDGIVALMLRHHKKHHGPTEQLAVATLCPSTGWRA